MFATGVIRSLQELGCYHLEEKLDHGGMGEIWRARHRMLARPVAVKLIRPELLGVKTPVEAASLVARFQREAEATSALHSSHTISLHDFGVTPEGAFYYVMELLDGLDLETLVRRYGPVPPERAIHILIQACDSLAEAHATGLIHRDVKPSNILTCHWGLKWDFVKVLDFGLVKTAWSHGQRRPPDLGGHDHRDAGLHGARGRARRRAARRARRPLRARLRRVLAADGRARVRRPHAGGGADAPHQDAARAAVRAPGREIPAALETVVLSCLAKDPDERPQSAEWLASRLAECVTAEAWTPARARAWWEENRPAAGAEAPAATRTTVTPASPPAPQPADPCAETNPDGCFTHSRRGSMPWRPRPRSVSGRACRAPSARLMSESTSRSRTGAPEQLAGDTRGCLRWSGRSLARGRSGTRGRLRTRRGAAGARAPAAAGTPRRPRRRPLSARARAGANGAACGRRRAPGGRRARLPYPDASFDLVVDFGTCYHIARQGQALREICARAGGGGRFVHETRVSQLLSHPVRSWGRPALARRARAGGGASRAALGQPRQGAALTPARVRSYFFWESLEELAVLLSLGGRARGGRLRGVGRARRAFVLAAGPPCYRGPCCRRLCCRPLRRPWTCARSR